MHTTDKRVISNYLQWRIVQGFSPFLPPKMQTPFYQFKANQTGIQDATPPERLVKFFLFVTAETIYDKFFE